MTEQKANALLFHGGGLCDSSNAFIREFAEQMTSSHLFEKVYVGFNSFACLLTKKFLEWTPNEYFSAILKSGGYFGTCRNIDLTMGDNRQIAIATCKEYNIKYIFVAGGDGSARHLAEISEDFLKKGILCAFVMPLTIDGINGGVSLGLTQAVRKSIAETSNFVASALHTWEGLNTCVAGVELQGRNRDDILANVLYSIYRQGGISDFSLKEIDIFAVPANYPVSHTSLIRAVDISSNPTLILISEGAKIKTDDMQKMFSRKVRTFKIAHLSQINACTNDSDVTYIFRLCEKIWSNMPKLLRAGEPFSFKIHGDGQVSVMPIDYYAKLNPREGQKAELPSYLEDILKAYMPRKY